MGLSSFDEAGFPGWLGLVWFSVVAYLILINYYVTGFMVIHQLVVISLNKILPRLEANAVESANLRAS